MQGLSQDWEGLGTSPGKHYWLVIRACKRGSWRRRGSDGLGPLLSSMQEKPENQLQLQSLFRQMLTYLSLVRHLHFAQG